MLQSYAPARVLCVFGAVDGFLPVERYDERVAFGRNLIVSPFASGLRHWIDLGDVDDRAGAIGRLWAFVPDVHLVCVVGGDLGRVRTTNEDATVGVLLHPELRPELKIAVGIL